MDALKVGDRIIETTPAGRTLRSMVTAVGVEPKYRHGYDGRWVQLRRDGGRTVVMLESDVLSAAWMTVERRVAA